MSWSAQSSLTRLEEIVGGLYAARDPRNFRSAPFCGVRPLPSSSSPWTPPKLRKFLSLAAAENWLYGFTLRKRRQSSVSASAAGVLRHRA